MSQPSLNASPSTLDRAGLEQRLADAPAGLRLQHCVLDGEDLEGLDLTRAEFVGCSFAGTRWRRAQLAGTRWRGCRAGGADFELCDLTDARFESCDLNNTQWRRARLSSAEFCEVKLTGARFTDAVTLGMSLKRSLAVNADLRGLSFRKQVIEALNLEGADLSGCDFTDAILRDCNLSNAALKNARFTRADLRGAKLGDIQVGDLLQHYKGSTISTDQAASIIAGLGVQVL